MLESRFDITRYWDSTNEEKNSLHYRCYRMEYVDYLKKNNGMKFHSLPHTIMY